jgi:branched-chain amino acid aminotransferase
MRNVGTTIYLNGRWLRRAAARVSVFDRGFMYGDGIFETFRAYRGVPYALDEHLERLHESAHILALPLPEIDWHKQSAQLLRRNRLLHDDAWIRIMLTRGESPPGLLPAASMKSTTVMMAGPLRIRRVLSSATLLPFAQESFLAEHKSLNYLLGVVGRAYAARHGTDEGIYVGSNGALREGTTSSLFIVRDGSLYTVPTVGILPGVTRRMVLDLAFRAGIRTVERALHAQDLFEGDEAFLTSSLQEIVPLVQVDNRPIGNGRSGEVTRKLQRLYRAAVRRETAQQAGRISR